MIKRVSATFFIILGILIIFNLGKQIATTLNSGKRLDQAVNDLTSLQQENRHLREQLQFVESYDYIEKTARDELNMAKPDETVVIIPDQVLNQVVSSTEPKPAPKISNWQRWLKLLFP